MAGRFSLLGAITSAMNGLGTLLVLFIMAVILTDVIGRTALHAPLVGTSEIVAMSIAAIVFLQFPSTLRAGRVIRSDGLLDWVGTRSARAAHLLSSAFHILGGIMFVVVTIYVAPLALAVWRDGEFYGNIGVFTFPKWPVFGVITFGSAMMVLQYFAIAWQDALDAIRGKPIAEVDISTKVLS